MKSLSFKLVFIFLLAGVISVSAQQNSYPLIPYPTKLTPGKGSFLITDKTNIMAASQFKNEAEMLRGFLNQGLVVKLAVTNTSKNQIIKLVYDAAISQPEGYKLIITPQQV